jgi:hypothetical protein
MASALVMELQRICERLDRIEEHLRKTTPEHECEFGDYENSVRRCTFPWCHVTQRCDHEPREHFVDKKWGDCYRCRSHNV